MNKYYNFSVEVKGSISLYDIIEFMVDAHRLDWVKSANLVADEDGQDATLTIVDENLIEHSINVDDVFRGYQMWIQNGGYRYIDDDVMEDEEADMIIQYAVFGCSLEELRMSIRIQGRDQTFYDDDMLSGFYEETFGELAEEI